MKILVLGGSGYIGRAICRELLRDARNEVFIGARRPASIDGAIYTETDATDASSLANALRGADVIVNCVTGSAQTIETNARAIAAAARSATAPLRVIHLSSMAVYGQREGLVTEADEPAGDLNWYAQAKLRAEETLLQACDSLAMLRIGCVFGIGSKLWVDRTGLLLRRRRLGDLGEHGDGWSNLVDVEDVAVATRILAGRDAPDARIVNFSAPASPRWNGYFRDFALAIAATPLAYKTHRSMLLESRLVAPPLKVLERLVTRARLPLPTIQSIPPSLLRLWGQQIRLGTLEADALMQGRWKPYADSVAQSADYFLEKYGR